MLQHSACGSSDPDWRAVFLASLQGDEQLSLSGIALIYELANAVCMLVERGGRGRDGLFETIEEVRANRVALRALEHFEEFTRSLKGAADAE